jgi:hypothetical protein
MSNSGSASDTYPQLEPVSFLQLHNFGMNSQTLEKSQYKGAVRYSYGVTLSRSFTSADLNVATPSSNLYRKRQKTQIGNGADRRKRMPYSE